MHNEPRLLMKVPFDIWWVSLIRRIFDGTWLICLAHVERRPLVEGYR